MIEILMTVIVVGILAAVSLPSFQDSIYTARRGEAKADLLRLAQVQAKLRTKSDTYTDIAAEITSANSSNDYYTFSVPTYNSGGFEILATPEDNQAGDKCGTLKINQLTELTSVNNQNSCPRP